MRGRGWSERVKEGMPDDESGENELARVARDA